MTKTGHHKNDNNKTSNDKETDNNKEVGNNKNTDNNKNASNNKKSTFLISFFGFLISDPTSSDYFAISLFFFS